MNEAIRELRVKKISYEAETINAYELVTLDGSALAPFTAGSHIDVHLPNGLIRSYSLLNDPRETHRYIIAVNKDGSGRGGSLFMHSDVRVGDRIKVSLPRNHFALDENASATVLIAGGIGITPLMSMARRLQTVGRPWELFYAARTRSAAAFLDELATIGPSASSRVHLDFDDAREGRLFDLAAIVNSTSKDAHLYCCGPAPMLAAFEAETVARPRDHIHVEYFQASEAVMRDGGFQIELARSKRTLTVAPGRTILDTVLDAGIMPTYACAEGVCGTCETRVVSGIPDHRDQILTDDERASNKIIMICCSGSKSDTLVLDL